MANMKVTYPYDIYDGMPFVFKASADSASVDKVILNNFEFDLVDENGNSLSRAVGVYKSGAYLLGVIDNRSRKLYIVNADTNGYIESQLAAIRAQIAGFNRIQTEFDSGDMNVSTYSYDGNKSLFFVITLGSTLAYMDARYTMIIDKRSIPSEEGYNFKTAADGYSPLDPSVEAYVDGNGYPTFHANGNQNIFRVVGYY